MPYKSVWSLSICFIRAGLYLNKHRRIEEQGTVRFILVKVADYKMWEKSFRARNILSPCDGNSSRAPMQELEANAGVMRKKLRWFSEYNQQDATFLNLFISVRRSTCFRRFFRPSSVSQNCTYCYLLLAAGSSNGLTNS